MTPVLSDQLVPTSSGGIDDGVYSLDFVEARTAASPEKMSVYIAGPMTNRPHFNYEAFDALERILEGQGFIVASPARLDDVETRRQALQSLDGSPGSGALNGETWGDFLARDVKVIADIVDGVVLMPGWETSKGARLEAFIARHVGKPVFYSIAGREMGPNDPHDSICLCSEVFTEHPVFWFDDVVLAELDDAELDHVLTLADTLTLLKIEQDSVREQVEPVVKTTPVGPAAVPGLASAIGSRVNLPDDGKATNPKDAIGSGKIPMHLWPKTATILGSLGLLDGMLKYGRSNWRAAGVRASIYVDAIERHVGAWFEGEDVDPDSGLPHLAHALACLGIIVDAEAAGMLNDDRQFNGAGYRPFIDGLTAEVAKAKERHADKDPKHYTIQDD